jgi:acyl-coenzyme A thioesterase PaaI-like protein
MADVEATARAVSHYPRCFGCGEANPSGLGLRAHWDGSELRAVHTAPLDAEGGPGVVHGGYIGALVDEAMALAATSACDDVPMTRRIELDFRAPTLVGTPIAITARVAEERDRTLLIDLTAESTEHGYVCFEARGVYVKVPAETWLERMETQQRGTMAIDFAKGDPSNWFRWQSRKFITEIFAAGRLGADVTLGVELADVEPSRWTFAATGEGVSVEEGHRDALDVVFHGDFSAWQDYIHREATLEALGAGGRGRAEGDVAALERFVDCLEWRW